MEQTCKEYYYYIRRYCHLFSKNPLIKYRNQIRYRFGIQIKILPTKKKKKKKIKLNSNILSLSLSKNKKIKAINTPQ